MNKKDEQSLRAIQYAIQQDEEVCESIKRSIDAYDRARFAEAVERVLNRLQITVTDKERFLNTAYEWFKKRKMELNTGR